jgi:hypothetical protein
MKIFKLLLATATVLSWISCNSNEICCTIVDVDISIHYLNENGQSLFDGNLPYNADDINLYYKKGKEFQKVFNPNYDHPKNCFTYQNEKMETIIRVFPSDVYEGNFSTTLIAFTESIVDTMICEFELGPSREVCKNVWYNGVKMKNREFDIVKK